jgi:hypothetical protein
MSTCGEVVETVSEVRGDGMQVRGLGACGNCGKKDFQHVKMKLIDQ